MVLKQLFFQNITKNRPAAGGFALRSPKPPAAGGSASRSPSIILLNYSTLLYSTRLSISIFSYFNYWFKSSPSDEFLVTCQHQAKASDLPFYNIFAHTKNPLSKFLMTSLNVIWAPPPQSKILATPMISSLF